MRHVVFALSVFFSAATAVGAAAITPLPVASNNVILAQSSDEDSPNFYSRNYSRPPAPRTICLRHHPAR